MAELWRSLTTSEPRKFSSSLRCTCIHVDQHDTTQTSQMVVKLLTFSERTRSRVFHIGKIVTWSTPATHQPSDTMQSGPLVVTKVH